MTLYLDLDGVFADFDQKVFTITGEHSSQLKPKSLWGQLSRVEHLFLTLDPIPDSIAHFQELQQRSKVPIEIITGLPLPYGNFKTGESDKRAWVKQHLDPNMIVHCTTRRGDKIKHIQFNDDILVDDMDYNINGWRDAGAIGILHKNWEMTIVKLETLGILL